MRDKLKATFVTPWYGNKLPGGAEAEARRTCQELVRAGVDVEVLTTCLAGLGTDWDTDALPAGLTTEDGVKVRRFPTAKRDGEAFARINDRVVSGQRLSLDEEETFYQNMVHSPELLDYLAAHPESGPFFYIPYLFTTSVWGPMVHPEKSVLIPCLHNEGYARMQSVKRAFETARAAVFHVPEERDLALSLYDMKEKNALLLGEGVDTDWQGDGARFREKFGIKGPFVLYAGRKDQGKNTPLLCQYFHRYVTERGGADGLKLLLIGNLPAPIPPGAEDHINDLGFVDIQDKYDAYAAADAFVQPSLLESFSIVIMEAWLAGTPVMVHSGCAVTKGHVVSSQGGLHFPDYPRFAEGLEMLLTNPDLARTMGEKGREYVLANYSWPGITEKFIKLIKELDQEPAPEPKKPGAWQNARARRAKNQVKKGPAIHQMLPDFSFGDAIGNDTLAIRKALRSWGFESEIFARHIHPKMAGQALNAEDYPRMAGPEDVVIFHFSIGHPLADAFIHYPGRKVLRYHNITPAHFLEELYPESAERARMGREQLKELSKAVELGIGVSPYNAGELKQAGCENTEVVPILLDFDHLETPPDQLITTRFMGTRPNILHVGRVVPNKCIEDLIKTHYWLTKLIGGARLLIVGGGGWQTAYGGGLRKLVEDLNVPDVHFSGHVSTAGLMGYYKASDLYLCLSEHEGFCVPLVEAMHFGLPVVAYDSTGVTGTLGKGGILLPKKDHILTAEVIAKVLVDKKLKQDLSRAGREREKAFWPEQVREQLKNTLINKLGLDID
ncbi:glycosyltransferase family 4 protein [Dethiosulfatarculus sandiegensis]|uniref:Glycosyl transferase family 1 n=1 Tax=Dethiosulfatarculus sandiegensis TaxID=1429043 RepID=A0A0D2JD07_9BACT|nr:glycosyltransferase family 4 protein [Dethiosulfatarculus sandiegensis]KIX13636.1 glycosyl transferase family 1 [Dethiosulfatarculus sandiegensis]